MAGADVCLEFMLMMELWDMLEDRREWKGVAATFFHLMRVHADNGCPTARLFLAGKAPDGSLL
jgi:hypothetical protein